MAYKTLIGGTAYEVTGGKTLIDETAYNIVSGKTLVGGTAYDIGFGVPVHVMTFNSVHNIELSYLEINGQKIAEDCIVIVPIGTIVKCCVRGVNNNPNATIFLNNESVSVGDVDYEFTITSETNIELGAVIFVGGVMNIATAPNVILKTALYTGASVLSATINGIALNNGLVNYGKAYAIGSVIEFTFGDVGKNGSVKINGNIVFEGIGKYSYILRKSAYIVSTNKSFTDNGEELYYGVVEITEY